MFKVSELRNKEVINMTDGERLGYVCDMEINRSTGHVQALIVPGRDKQKFFGKNSSLRIPWSEVERIGQDLIVINKTYTE
jgi:YlmC/YmxH family sporulation protein